MDGLDIAELCEAVARQIGTGATITAYAFEALDPQMPCACVTPRPGEMFVDYHETMGTDATAALPTVNAVANVDLRITLYAGGDAESAQHTLYDLLAAGANHPRSVFNALCRRDGQLRTVVADLIVTGASWRGQVARELPDGAVWMAWSAYMDVQITLER